MKLVNDPEDARCTSLSEDGRRCHGDVGHDGTHWAAASRVWSDTETLVSPPTIAYIRKGTTLRVHGTGTKVVEIVVADVEKLDDGSVRITPEPA